MVVMAMEALGSVASGGGDQSPMDEGGERLYGAPARNHSAEDEDEQSKGSGQTVVVQRAQVEEAPPVLARRPMVMHVDDEAGLGRATRPPGAGAGAAVVAKTDPVVARMRDIVDGTNTAGPPAQPEQPQRSSDESLCNNQPESKASTNPEAQQQQQQHQKRSRHSRHCHHHHSHGHHGHHHHGHHQHRHQQRAAGDGPAQGEPAPAGQPAATESKSSTSSASSSAAQQQQADVEHDPRCIHHQQQPQQQQQHFHNGQHHHHHHHHHRHTRAHGQHHHHAHGHQHQHHAHHHHGHHHHGHHHHHRQHKRRLVQEAGAEGAPEELRQPLQEVAVQQPAASACCPYHRQQQQQQQQQQKSQEPGHHHHHHHHHHHRHHHHAHQPAEGSVEGPSPGASPSKQQPREKPARRQKSLVAAAEAGGEPSAKAAASNELGKAKENVEVVSMETSPQSDNSQRAAEPKEPVVVVVDEEEEGAKEAAAAAAAAAREARESGERQQQQAPRGEPSAGKNALERQMSVDRPTPQKAPAPAEGPATSGQQQARPDSKQAAGPPAIQMEPPCPQQQQQQRRQQSPPRQQPQVMSQPKQIVESAVSPDRRCRLCWCCCCPCSGKSQGGGQRNGNEQKQNAERSLTSVDKCPSLPNVSLETIRSWADSFDRLMKCPEGRKVFQDFLRCEYSEENILFWIACEELKNEKEAKNVANKARDIYEDYISILSAKEVSLDSRVRDVINNNIKKPTSSIFDEAQLQIYTLMHRDSYPRFINSPMYKKLAQQQTLSRKGSS